MNVGPDLPQRDLVGYGRSAPRVEWPDGARVAVTIQVNYEEGAEYTAAADGRNEALLEIYYGERPFESSGLSLQFRVDDVDRFEVPDEPRYAHRGPEQRPWGSRYLFLIDPNGISVVVFSGTSL